MSSSSIASKSASEGPTSSPIAFTVTLIVSFFIVRYFYALTVATRLHLRTAAASGIPYYFNPFSFFSPIWLTVGPGIRGVLSRILPRALLSRNHWFALTHPEWGFREGFAPFRDLGETFLMVIPTSNTHGDSGGGAIMGGGMMLVTAEPEVIMQICNMRCGGGDGDGSGVAFAFPKPIKLYKAVDIFGKSVLTAEGADWRRQRRVTAGAFTDRSNRLVWSESLFQARAMLNQWQRQSVVSDPSEDTMRLSLSVISRAEFDIRCDWPSQDGGEQQKSSLQDDDAPRNNVLLDKIGSAGKAPEGFTMTYTESLQTLLKLLLLIIIFPLWLLELLPLKSTRSATTAFHEWGRYMGLIYDVRLSQFGSSSSSHEASKDSTISMDLMGSMIKASSSAIDDTTPGEPDSPTPKARLTAGLSKTEIQGNSFVMFLAGHETTANMIHFTLLLLAQRPGFQRALQADLDTLLAGASPPQQTEQGENDVDAWTFEEQLPRLLGSSLLFATIQETLRLIPPVMNVPKCTTAPQRIKIRPKENVHPGSSDPNNNMLTEVVVPAGTTVVLSAAGVHRNPRFWPHQVNPATGKDDLNEFRPERWLKPRESNTQPTSGDKGRGEGGVAKVKSNEKDIEELPHSSLPESGAGLFSPPRGAFLAFSEGPRSCLGRRFAQVELLAVLACVLKQCSVELYVPGYESVEEAGSKTEAEKHKAWEHCRDEVDRKLRDELGTIVTAQLRGAPVAIRVVERGQELFNYDV